VPKVFKVSKAFRVSKIFEISEVCFYFFYPILIHAHDFLHAKGAKSADDSIDLSDVAVPDFYAGLFCRFHYIGIG